MTDDGSSIEAVSIRNGPFLGLFLSYTTQHPPTDRRPGLWEGVFTHLRRQDETHEPRGCAVLAALIGGWRCRDLAGRDVLELFPAVALGPATSLEYH